MFTNERVLKKDEDRMDMVTSATTAGYEREEKEVPSCEGVNVFLYDKKLNNRIPLKNEMYMSMSIILYFVRTTSLVHNNTDYQVHYSYFYEKFSRNFRIH